MEDGQIIELFWARSENAIAEADARHGKYCRAIAYNILHSREDSEECVNDTWMNAWEAMPPQRPGCLSAFLGKITRNLALNRYKLLRAEKRGGGQVALALEELGKCAASTRSEAGGPGADHRCAGQVSGLTVPAGPDGVCPPVLVFQLRGGACQRLPPERE